MRHATATKTKAKTERYEMTDDLPDHALIPMDQANQNQYIDELELKIASMHLPSDPVDLADHIFGILSPLQRERFRLRFLAMTRATDESTMTLRAHR